MSRKRRVAIGGAVIVVGLSIAAVLRARHPDLVLIGIVDANDVVVTPRVQGVLDSLLIDEGATVKAGQLIARLDATELAAQAASVAAATSGAAAQLAQSRSGALRVDETTAAAKTAAQARLASARAALAREQAALAQDSADMARASMLVNSGGMAPADLERATNAFRAQQAVVSARREEVGAAVADVENAQSGEHEVAAARSNVATTEARVRGARADSLAAAARLEYAVLRAPISGIVQVLSARRGELVGPGTPVAVIIDPDQLWVRVAVPETDAGRISVGDSLNVRLATDETIRGRVISKGIEGEFATQRDVSSSKRDIRAVALRVAIPNPRHTIVPGMTAQVVVPTGR
jgi:multidrug resistance efflux pump